MNKAHAMSKVRTLKFLSFLLKPLSTFEKSYLLESWKLDCAGHSDRSAMFVGHLGTLFIHFGIVI
jgi:hypothetical protein